MNTFKANFLAILILIISTFCILININKINTDIFDLLDFDNAAEHKSIINHINSNNTKSVIILTKDVKNIDKINQKIKEYFNTDNTNDIDKIKQELSNLKLITLNYETTQKILNNPNNFIYSKLKSFYMPNNFNILGYQLDFFNLLSDSKLLEQKIKLDFDTMQAKVNDYFLIQFELNNNYNNNLVKLFDYCTNLKDTYIQSSIFYTEKSMQTGKQESTLFSLISLVLNTLLLILAFKRFKIFYLLLIIVLSLSSSLAFSFIVLDKIHILSIVISSSLIGLILDFPMHFISSNIEKTLEKTSIKKLLKVFIIGLLISSSGYLIYLFSSIHFLIQIAVISISSLIFALLYTYFILPVLIENTIFMPCSIYKKIFGIYIKFLFILKKYFYMILAIISIFSIYEIYTNIDNLFDENIKNYAKLEKNLERNSIKVAQILNNNSFRFALFSSLEEQEELNDKNLFGANNFINSIQTQNKLKNIFKSLANDEEFLISCEKYGFKRDLIKSELLKLANTQIKSYEELLHYKSLQSLKTFKTKDYYIAFVNNNSSKNYKTIDYIEDVNKSFIMLKTKSIELKILAFIIAFIILFVMYKNKSFLPFYCVVLSSLFSLSLFLALEITPDIFAIFGFILGSIVGVDYMIFALNDKLKINERIYGIKLASLTSAISFLVLGFSKTQAVFSFGLSVGINIIIAMIFASILALLQFDNNIN